MPFVRYNVPVMIRRIAQERRPRYVDRRRQASRRRRSPSTMQSRPSQALAGRQQGALSGVQGALSGVQNFLGSPAGRALTSLASAYFGGSLSMLPRPPSLPMLPPPR